MINFSGATYATILASMLSRVPDTYDKRDTSPIQTALGPAAYQIAGIYLALGQIQQQAFITTATGNDLERLAFLGGISRLVATPAVRLGVFNTPITLGSRFSTINGSDSINFIATSATDDPLQWWLTAETAGTIGNQYTGNILPISTIPGLTSAQITDIIVDGSDEETDDELRVRLAVALTDRSFAGNIAAYRKYLTELTSVTADDGSTVAVKIGGVQVYPTWDGGGTVKCSVVGSDYLPINSAVLELIQNDIDPDSGSGLGMAPIGAQVTMVTPTTSTINVSATISHTAGTTVSSLQTKIEEAIEDYLDEVRKEWGEAEVTDPSVYVSKVFIARVTAAILGVSGVTNVTNVNLNDAQSDITLTENATTQEVPVLGTVTLTEG